MSALLSMPWLIHAGCGEAPYMGLQCAEDSDCQSKYQFVEGTACIGGTCQCRSSTEVICCAKGDTDPETCYLACRPCSECASGTLLAGSCPEIEVVWLYAGPKEAAPDCPDGKPPIFEGWTNLDAPPCEECSCGPAECTVPDRIGLHGSAGCGAPPIGEFAPAMVTAGVCATAPEATGPFTAITYYPPTLAPCEPTGPQDPPPPTWGLFGRACAPDTASTLFQECIEADVCPSEFPVQRIFHSGLEDSRSCAACACEAPDGGECAAVVSVYEGATCQVLALAAAISNTVSNTCVNLPMTRDSIGSLRADWQESVAGTCKPVPRTTAGQATPIGPRSFCCRG